jgi:F-type H+-transporting ATPase subunit alpha
LIYAGTRGYLDNVPVSQIKAWQNDFLRFASTQAPEIARSINDEGTKFDLTDDAENRLKQVLSDFNQTWTPAE